MLKQRRFNNVESTLFQRCVPAGDTLIVAVDTFFNNKKKNNGFGILKKDLVHVAFSVIHEKVYLCVIIRSDVPYFP